MSEREHLCCLILISFFFFFLSHRSKVKCQTQSNGALCQDSQAHLASAIPLFPAWHHLPRPQGHHFAFSWLLCPTRAIQPPTTTALPSQKKLREEPAPRATLVQGLSSHSTTGQALQRKTTVPCLAAASSYMLSHLDESYPHLQLLTILTFSTFKISLKFLFLHGLFSLHHKISADEWQCCSGANIRASFTFCRCFSTR